MITVPAPLTEAVRSKNFSRLKLTLTLYRNRWDASSGKYAPEETGRDITHLLKKANKLKWKYDSDSAAKYEPDNITLELYNRKGLFFEGKAGSIFDGETYLLYNSKIVISLSLAADEAVCAPMFTGFVSDGYSFKPDEQTVSLPLNTGWSLLETVSAESYSEAHGPEALTPDGQDEAGRTFLTSKMLVGGLSELRYGADWESADLLTAEQDYEVSNLSSPDEAATVELKFQPDPALTIFARYYTWKQNQTLNELLRGMAETAGLAQAELSPLYWTFAVWILQTFPETEALYGCYQDPGGGWRFNTWSDGQAGGTVAITGKNVTIFRKTDFFRMRGLIRLDVVFQQDGYTKDTHCSRWRIEGEGGCLQMEFYGGRHERYAHWNTGQRFFRFSGGGEFRANFFVEIDVPGKRIRWTGQDWRELWFTPSCEVLWRGCSTGNVHLITRYTLGGHTITPEEEANGYLRTAAVDFGASPRTRYLSAPVFTGRNVEVTPWESDDNTEFSALPPEANNEFYAGTKRFKKLEVRPRQTNTFLTGLAIERQASDEDTRMPYFDFTGVTAAEVLSGLADLFFYEAGFKNDGTFFMRPKQTAKAAARDLTDAEVVKSSKLTPGLDDLYTAVKVSLDDDTAVYKAEENAKPGLIDKYGVRVKQVELPSWLKGGNWYVLRQIGQLFLQRLSRPVQTLEVTAALDPSLELGDCVRLLHNTPGLPDIYADWYKFANFPGYFINTIIDAVAFDFEKYQMTLTLRDVSDGGTAPQILASKFKYTAPVQFGAAEYAEGE